MVANSSVSIRDAVGGALRFVREEWRFVLAVAGVAALAQGVLLLPGPSLVWMIALVVALIAAHTTLTTAALSVPKPFLSHVAGDATRVAAALTMLALLVAIIFIALSVLAMSVIIGPYQEEITAAKENQEAIRAIMERAMQARPEVISWVTIAGVVIVFVLTTGFYLAAPATIDRKRISLFESWAMTRGNILRIAGARLMLLLPALIFVSALQALISIALATPTGDPVQMLQYASTNPIQFAAFYTASIFIQIAIFSALEAALSARLYRAIAANAPPRAA